MVKDRPPHKNPLIFYRLRIGSEPVREWLKQPPVDRLLDPQTDITLSSLQRAAAMIGRRVSIELI
jgi:hypothetical protein